ncbi:cell division protein ZapA [Flammeovirga agarivorans]|uniref:Cell division protein ZapA n=1 Tax=Flammeovirga agarivorans TaxID=2726742 RepID=A0A7X8SH53_9BACT|nr:cell division protein ZapA [Flammeovirga agarivorans]NLR90161.1 cell division protein ZapA [Flammeovirga agarivorans]
MGLRSPKESIQLKLCGKVYNVKATKTEEHLLLKAADLLNHLLEEKKAILPNAEIKDLLTITAFDLIVKSMTERDELQNTNDRLKALNKQLDDILQ